MYRETNKSAILYAAINKIIEYDNTLINVIDNTVAKRTAMHMLAYHPSIGNIRLIKLLDDNGGDWCIKNSKGKNAIENLNQITKDDIKTQLPEIWRKLTNLIIINDFNI